MLFTIKKYHLIQFWGSFFLLLIAISPTYSQHQKDSVAYVNYKNAYLAEQNKEKQELVSLTDSLIQRYNLHLLQDEIYNTALITEKNQTLNKILMFCILGVLIIYLYIRKQGKQLQQEYKNSLLLMYKAQDFYAALKKIEESMIEEKMLSHKKKSSSKTTLMSIKTHLYGLLENKKPIPTQKDFALQMGLDAVKLRKIIQESSWKSFNNLINEIRIEYAVTYIHKNPNINLKTLAQLLLISYNTFKTHFIKYVGIPPLTYKKMVQKGKKNDYNN